jgi:endoglucanase
LLDTPSSAHICNAKAREPILLRALCIVLVAPLLLLTGGAQAGDAPITFARGVSIPTGLKTSDLERIKARGFDFIRVHVDPTPLLASDDRKLDEAVARLEETVRRATQTKLKVIVDLQPANRADLSSTRYRPAVSSVAGMLARVGTDRTALKLMDASQDHECQVSEDRQWEAVLTGLIQAAQDGAPDLALVVSGRCNGITGLVTLDPAKLGNDRVIYSFDFYEPRSFTHQGLGQARDVKGVPWPADDVATDLAMIFSRLLVSRDDLTFREHAKRLAHVRRHLAIYIAEGWNEGQIKNRFAELRSWTEKHGVPRGRLLLDGFGAVTPTEDRGGALDADRFRWLAAVRRAAETLGAAWSYWEAPGADSVAAEALGMSQRAALPMETPPLNAQP